MAAAKKYSFVEWRENSEAIDAALKDIDDYASGKLSSLRTCHHKLNNELLRGIPYWSILTLAGMSGSGKSTILENWKISLIENNPKEKVEVLAFEYEMLPSAQIIRTLSSKMQLSTSDLLSSKEKLNEEQLSKIKEIGSEMKKYPIFYVDIPARPIEMYETILEFCNQRKIKAEKKTLLVTIDFVSLCKGNASDSEKDIVDSLYKTLVEAKKRLYDMGIRVIFIALSQLNRDIESVERRDPKYQFPTRNDLYSASSIYTNSDIVIISHNPSVINGIEKYGPYNWDIKDEDGKCYLYWHIIKNRMGKNSILKMKEDFSNSKVLDA